MTHTSLEECENPGSPTRSGIRVIFWGPQEIFSESIDVLTLEAGIRCTGHGCSEVHNSINRGRIEKS